MTVLSLFVPLVATSFAFWFLASEEEFSYWRGLISGVIVGLTSESPRAACFAASARP
jgi:NO-binding membrane sensor protein with MHYT domain